MELCSMKSLGEFFFLTRHNSLEIFLLFLSIPGYGCSIVSLPLKGRLDCFQVGAIIKKLL